MLLKCLTACSYLNGINLDRAGIIFVSNLVRDAQRFKFVIKIWSKTCLYFISNVYIIMYSLEILYCQMCVECKILLGISQFNVNLPENILK